jgi:uncharacterized glyoxalase superfamily protein PhnB
MLCYNVAYLACRGGRIVLLNWEFAGPDRYFTIRVPDVRLAGAFYQIVFGALELSRRQACNGEQIELGLAIGNTRFYVSSEDHAGMEHRELLRLAQDFGVPFIAVILTVEDRESIAARAIENGARLTFHNAKDAIIVTDPFASHWALVEHKPAIARQASSLRIKDDKVLH